MEKSINPQANIFNDLQHFHALIEDINERISDQYEKIENAKEELRELQTDRNAYYTEFLERAKGISFICEQYSNEMDRVNKTAQSHDEQLEKLRRKLTGADEPTALVS